MAKSAVMVDIRKVVAVGVVGAVIMLLAVLFLRLVGPAAAREVKAACTGLQPATHNPTFKHYPAPEIDFTLPNHNGQPVKLSDFRGKVVFLNFWATWCKVCESEKPALIGLHNELSNDDFVIVTVASDTGWGKIAKKFPRGLPMTVLLDKPVKGNLGPVTRRYGLSAVPESFVIDRSGTIRYHFINKRDWDSDVAITCLRALRDS